MAEGNTEKAIEGGCQWQVVKYWSWPSHAACSFAAASKVLPQVLVSTWQLINHIRLPGQESNCSNLVFIVEGKFCPFLWIMISWRVWWCCSSFVDVLSGSIANWLMRFCYVHQSLQWVYRIVHLFGCVVYCVLERLSPSCHVLKEKALIDNIWVERPWTQSILSTSASMNYACMASNRNCSQLMQKCSQATVNFLVPYVVLTNC